MPRIAALVVIAFVSACSSPKPTPDAGPQNPELTFTVVLDDLPVTLLSAWESNDGVLYAVGGNATRAMVLRHDAQGWWEMDPGTSQALWWVHGFAANDVYAVGNSGVITHFDGTRWTVEREGGDFTLYGVWGSIPSNMQAVGGNLQSSRASGVVEARMNAWAAQTSQLPFFKIWGRSTADYFVVGERGLIARGGAGGLRAETSPTTQRLTTVHGNTTEVYAVGGLTEPTIVRLVDASWRLITPPGNVSVLNGVAVANDGTTLIVGLDGYLAVGHGEVFSQVPTPTSRGLHAAVKTRDGFVAVGGDLLGTLGNGVLISSAPTSLTASAIQPWPNDGVRFDAGIDDAGTIDGGEEDAGREVPDGGWLQPGESCDSRYADCDPSLHLSCWFVFGPFKSYCADFCADVSECGSYGPNACCKVPGPQVTTSVCLPEIACDGGN